MLLFYRFCYQLVRELKNEVSKLREIIKAEGLEARVAEYGKYVLCDV